MHLRAKAVEAETAVAPPPPVERLEEQPIIPAQPVQTAASQEQRREEAPSITRSAEIPITRAEVPLAQERELGKGGKQHRYLQALVKELAEQAGLKGTIEAPLPEGAGQVDVLIERDGALAAVEISVTTPVEHERENLRKCLTTGYPRIAVVLAKSKRALASYRGALGEVVPEMDRLRVTFLTPEEIPQFVASLTPPPEAPERVVRGYRVKGSFTQASAADTAARQEALAKLIAKSLS